MPKPAPTPVPPIVCDSWPELWNQLKDFPLAQLEIDEDGDPVSSEWAFRGLQSWCYELEPAIEREAKNKSIPWSGLEILVRREFQSRASMHLRSGGLPAGDLDWLAYMQHYGVPTRLLDFSYSPFVGTYFALRGQSQGTCTHRSGFVRLWAVHVGAIRTRFERVFAKARAQGQQDVSRADRSDRKRLGIPRKRIAVSFRPDELASPRDRLMDEIEGTQRLVSVALAEGRRGREALKKSGCVCAALPGEFNPRLSSQQGLFLINCAVELTFQESLTRMMAGEENWCKILDISRRALVDIEGQLFQMNVHEQSLFPDLSGLAGLVRQKIRLHWK